MLLKSIFGGEVNAKLNSVPGFLCQQFNYRNIKNN